MDRNSFFLLHDPYLFLIFVSKKSKYEKEGTKIVKTNQIIKGKIIAIMFNKNI